MGLIEKLYKNDPMFNSIVRTCIQEGVSWEETLIRIILGFTL